VDFAIQLVGGAEAAVEDVGRAANDRFADDERYGNGGAYCRYAGCHNRWGVYSRIFGHGVFCSI